MENIPENNQKKEKFKNEIKINSTGNIIIHLKRKKEPESEQSLFKKPKKVEEKEFHNPPPIRRVTKNTLTKALEEENYEDIAYCLNNGIPPQEFYFGNHSRGQKSPLYTALSNDDYIIADLMIKGSFNPKEEHNETFMPIQGFKTKKMAQKCTLIDLAIKNDDVEIYKDLLEKNVNQYSKFEDWYLCIHFGAYDIMDYLLEGKLFLENPSLDGFPVIHGKPPLHLALEVFPAKNNRKHISLIKSLIKHAPEMVLLKDDKGRTAFEICQKRNIPTEITHLIRDTTFRENWKLLKESSEAGEEEYEKGVNVETYEMREEGEFEEEEEEEATTQTDNLPTSFSP